MLDLSEALFKFNPWWESAYRPKFVQRPEYAQFLAKNQANRDIVILTGIRRAGKTTLMKLAIARLLETLEPRFILYASLDSIALAEEIVCSGRRHSQSPHRLPRQRRNFRELGLFENQT